MFTIICKNDVETILNKIQETLQKHGIINSIYLVDQNEKQVVILMSKDQISDEIAKAWWSGYSSCLSGSGNQ